MLLVCAEIQQRHYFDFDVATRDFRRRSERNNKELESPDLVRFFFCGASNERRRDAGEAKRCSFTPGLFVASADHGVGLLALQSLLQSPFLDAPHWLKSALRVIGQEELKYYRRHI